MPPVDQPTAETRRLFWVLRIGVAMEAIGHGSLGLGRQAAWAPYFAVIGIHQDLAMSLMPVVGALDIGFGLLALFYPARGAVLYFAVWGLCTALLRPLAGESVWEAVERAGNVGAPLALWLLIRGGGPSSWFKAGCVESLDATSRERLRWVLKATTVLILLGHGLLQLAVRKPALAMQYTHLGLPGASAEPMMGAIECLLALAVAIRPAFALLVAVLAWKLATEALSPLCGSSVWVFVEHGGSYAAPLALALLQASRRGGEARSLGGRAAAPA